MTRLLDLPVEIFASIIRDLRNRTTLEDALKLALTCSTLHSIGLPVMYENIFIDNNNIEQFTSRCKVFPYQFQSVKHLTVSLTMDNTGNVVSDTMIEHTLDRDTQSDRIDNHPDDHCSTICMADLPKPAHNQSVYADIQLKNLSACLLTVRQLLSFALVLTAVPKKRWCTCDWSWKLSGNTGCF